jgi:hypothetical protein
MKVEQLRSILTAVDADASGVKAGLVNTCRVLNLDAEGCLPPDGWVEPESDVPRKRVKASAPPFAPDPKQKPAAPEPNLKSSAPKQMAKPVVNLVSIDSANEFDEKGEPQPPSGPAPLVHRLEVQTPSIPAELIPFKHLLNDATVASYGSMTPSDRSALILHFMKGASDAVRTERSPPKPEPVTTSGVSAAYEWASTHDKLKKFVHIYEPKLLKAISEGAYIDLARLLPPFPVSLFSAAASTIGSWEQAATAPAVHPIFSFASNQTALTASTADAYTIPLSAALGGTSRGGRPEFDLQIRSVRESKRQIRTIRDWDEAFYAYTNIVCVSSVENSGHREMLDNYRFQFFCLADTADGIGFEEAYKFDVQWRNKQAGFKSLNITDAGALYTVAITNAVFARTRPSLSHFTATPPAQRSAKPSNTASSWPNPKPARAPSQARIIAAELGKPNVCVNYNRGSCTFRYCKRAHTCLICGDAHPETDHHKSPNATVGAGSQPQSNMSFASVANASSASVANALHSIGPGTARQSAVSRSLK